MKTSEKTELVDYNEASQLTGIKIATLYSLVSRKQIPHIRFSSRIVRFSRVKLDDWITNARVEVKSQSKRLVSEKK